MKKMMAVVGPNVQILWFMDSCGVFFLFFFFGISPLLDITKESKVAEHVKGILMSRCLSDAS